MCVCVGVCVCACVCVSACVCVCACVCVNTQVALGVEGTGRKEGEGCEMGPENEVILMAQSQVGAPTSPVHDYDSQSCYSFSSAGLSGPSVKSPLSPSSECPTLPFNPDDELSWPSDHDSVVAVAVGKVESLAPPHTSPMLPGIYFPP